MGTNKDRFSELQTKLDSLIAHQQELQDEAKLLRSQIKALQIKENIAQLREESAKGEKPILSEKEENSSVQTDINISSPTPTRRYEEPDFPKAAKPKLNFEKIIGENLINKIGILILLFGLTIGANYAIENELISPLMRIVLGYGVSVTLLLFGWFLKTKYQSFSAVLAGGGTAGLYLITFAAHYLYDLIPFLPTFGLMLLFTLFAIIASLWYNLQVISIIAMVGAYAIPFLLSDGAANFRALFTYILIINIGMVVLSVFRYWKLLYRLSFFFTWLVYSTWFVLDFDPELHLIVALGFGFAFFISFYLAFIAYKIFKDEPFSAFNISLILINAFVYYSFGFATLSQWEFGEFYTGAFTLFNAFIHLLISVLVFKKDLSDRTINLFLTGLSFAFITLAIPVQLEGNWITLLWSIEAAILFWIGLVHSKPIYEKISYWVMALAFWSLLIDWGQNYNNAFESTQLFLVNMSFFTSAFFIACFVFINWLMTKHADKISVKDRFINTVLRISVPGILILSIFFSFFVEIEFYLQKYYYQSSIEQIKLEGSVFANYNYSLLDFKTVVLFIYSFVFIQLMIVANHRFLKSSALANFNMGAYFIATLGFLMIGIWALMDMRVFYLNQMLAESQPLINILSRYLAFAAVALVTYSASKHLSYLQTEHQKTISTFFEIFVAFTTIYILSAELIHLLELSGYEATFKLSLSLLWGSFSLALILLGIFLKKAHLRISAIVLFSVTLVKLFFYDINELTTLSKTIVFIVLGAILLLISFLYNKYKTQLFGEAKV